MLVYISCTIDCQYSYGRDHVIQCAHVQHTSLYIVNFIELQKMLRAKPEKKIHTSMTYIHIEFC